MRVMSLSLRDFRSYESAEAELHDGINVISGRNAQGKTNLLEAVYLLTGGRSFRTRFDREMIRFNAPQAEVAAEIYSGGREQRLKITLRRGAKKSMSRNGAAVRGAELSESLKAVLFCPDDLNIIKDGAAARRRLMDMAICQLRPGYARLISDYNRLYDNKMRILRDYRENPAMLDTLDEFSDGLLRASAQIIRYRASFVRRLASAAGPVHREFSGADECLEMCYRTVSAVTNAEAPAQEIYAELCAHQKAHRAAELASAQCLTGAHRDDMEITINGESARAFASQGQTRTAALSLKLAEREIFLQETGEHPVLLLDDVLSELDSRRQEFVLNRIGGGQTLITCCEDEQIRERTGGRVLFIQDGRVI